LKWRQVAMLEGFPEPRAGARRVSIMLDSEPPAVALIDRDGARQEVSFKNTLAVVHWPGQSGYVPPPPPRALSVEEQSRFETGRSVYVQTCMQCHKTTGLGQEGLAPP